jgi:hypothetical protein
MELAVGARLASLGSLVAVEKCSRLRRLSELKPQYSESKKRPFGFNTEWAGRTDNGNPGSKVLQPCFRSTELC